VKLVPVNNSPKMSSNCQVFVVAVKVGKNLQFFAIVKKKENTIFWGKLISGGVGEGVSNW
jgi:hypothetical protein